MHGGHGVLDDTTYFFSMSRSIYDDRELQPALYMPRKHFCSETLSLDRTFVCSTDPIASHQLQTQDNQHDDPAVLILCLNIVTGLDKSLRAIALALGAENSKCWATMFCIFFQISLVF
jgi:hypothetical protein